MSRLLVIFFFCCITLHPAAQVKILPAEAKQFVTKGYNMLDYITGDLNNDKRADAILVLKISGEDTVMEELKRPMLILLQQANGKLKLEKQNNNIILCRICGGVFGDPYENIEINNNSFTIHFYGGSAWRWSRRYKFKYSNKQKNWFIDEETESTYWNGDPDGTFNSIAIPAIESGRISFEKYLGENLENVQMTKWKVNVTKTYFYDTAALNSKPLKAYLIKGNKIESYRETKNFILVDFNNAKGKNTRGFIRKKDLIRQ